MRKIIFLLIITLLIVNPFILKGENDFIGFAEIKEKNWGGVVRDWPSIFKMKNVVKVKGPRGMLGIRLADNIPEINENTEVLLHFDKVSFGKVKVDGSSYMFRYSDVLPSLKTKVMGNGACVFQHIGSKIELTPREFALFSPGRKLKSFVISFYLYPTMIYDGGTIISMIAPAIEYKNELAGFKLYFKGNRLTWEFLNIFSDNRGNFRNVYIKELDPSPIYEWHHHFLYYNADKGIMTLYVDKKESAVEWITDNGKENGTILNGNLPESLAVPLTIGGNYIGYMDEFLISRGEMKEDGRIKDGKYKNKGELISDVLQFESKIVNIAKIKWESVENNGTAIRVLYRTSNNYFLPDDDEQNENSVQINNLTIKDKIKLKNSPKWKVANNDGIIREKSRYFQWKVILYGTNNRYTPVLKSLKLFYEKDLPPSAPILLSAIPGDGKITLKWVANKEEDIAGYRIYYGYYSHNYFGKGSDIGDSPITVGNVTSVTLKGLTNEKVYFFSITALDKSGQESGFSKEFATRPSITYKN